MNIELTVDKIVYGGDGIGQYNGIKVFIPYSAPQDHLLVSIKEKKKDYWVGQIEKVLKPSPFRIEPLCHHFSSCGSCHFQHINYDYQLVLKKLLANETLQRVGKIFLPVKNPLKAPAIWHYRNKTQLPLAPPLKIGYFQRRTHRVIDITKCFLHPVTFDQIKDFIKNSIKESETVYDERTHKGNIRHLILRQGVYTQDILVIIVTKENNLKPSVYQELTKTFPNIVGVVQNLNPAKTNRILGDKFIKLVGQDFYYEKLLNKKYRISAGSFFQVNTLQTETLINQVLTYLSPKPSDRVLDLFAGVGTFSIIIADSVAKITGIEINQSAIFDATENLKINRLKNVELICATVEEGITKFQKVDAIILDPPSKGCTKELLEKIATIKPSRIVYVSCNLATLARDLTFLDQLGYETIDISLVDLFPQTYHIETVAKIIPKIG